jgi:hypothetical protein
MISGIQRRVFRNMTVFGIVFFNNVEPIAFDFQLIKYLTLSYK